MFRPIGLVLDEARQKQWNLLQIVARWDLKCNSLTETF